MFYMQKDTGDCEDLQVERTYLTCTRRRWAGWRQWRQRLVRCWLQHPSGLLRRRVGAQRTWNKWRLAWKHCIYMSRSGRNKGELRRSVKNPPETSQDFQRGVFSQPSFTLCYPVLHFFFWSTIFLYAGLQKRQLEGPQEIILSISLPHTKSSQTISTEFSAFFF